MPESIQNKLERIRPPRVNITYDVELGDAIEKKELPFVAGVLGNFSGDAQDQLPRLGEREFTEVNPDNFDEVLENMQPHLTFRVENKLSDDPEAGQLAVDLDFESLEDFEPDQVAEQVEPLRKLLELREQLSDLRASLQGNAALEDILQEALTDEEKLEKLESELKRMESEGGSSDGEG
jgi:type VI secretion system protein ImpB